MFANFFIRKDMERVIAHILHSYKQLFCDNSYNNSEMNKGDVLLESAIFGVLLYARESKLSELDFYQLYIEKIDDYVRETQNISLEVLCYIAASLRGDLGKNRREIGEFFGESARKLGLGVDVFNKYEMPSGPGLRLIGQMQMLRFMTLK